MPLSELPINQIGGHGIERSPSASVGGSLLQSTTLELERPPGLLQIPSSVDSMLKNTTDVEDTVQFSAPSSPLQPLQRTSLSLSEIHHSRKPAARQYSVSYGDAHPKVILSQASSAAAGGIVSLHKARGQRSYREPARNYAVRHERQSSSSQNTDRSPSQPNASAANGSQGLVDSRGARPRSPFAYPTRLKRPGYRPSSPALSDLNRSTHGTMMGGYRDSPSHTSSPKYTHITKNAFPARHHGYNQTESLIRRYPPSPMMVSNSARTFSPLSSNEPTPGLHAGFDQLFSESHESLAPASTHSGWNRQSHSPSPVFYDYTEAFEENQFQTPPVSLAEQVILESPNTTYPKIRGHDSTASLLELHADSESPNRSSHKTMETLTDTYTSASNIHQTDADTDQIEEEIAAKSTLTSERNVSLLGPSQPNLSSSEELIPHKEGINETVLGNTGIGRPSLETKLVVVNEPHTSRASISRAPSPKESMYSVRSSVSREQSVPSSDTKSQTKTGGSETQPSEQVAVSSQPDSAVEQPDVNNLRPPLGLGSCDGWSEGEFSQIYAPTPERSMSSPSHRDRFSRIFSIGEVSAEGDELNTQNLALSGPFATDEMDAIRPKNASPMKSLSSRPESLSNTSPEKIQDTHQTLIRSKSDHETEPTSKLGGDLCKLGAPRSRSQSQLSVGKNAERVNSAPKSQFPHRIAVMRKPGLSLTVPPVQQIVEGLQNPDHLCRDSDTAPIKPLPEENTGLPQPVEQLSSMPSMVSFRSCSPPVNLKTTALPFSFTPLLASEEDERERNLQLGQNKDNKDGKDSQSTQKSTKYEMKEPSSRGSSGSLPGSRPWNFDTSYPWASQPPELNVTMPEQSKNPLQNENKPPRFKLKINRASLSNIGPLKLDKSSSPTDPSTPRKGSFSSELFRSRFATQKPRPSVTITQINSSHSGPVAARFPANNYSTTPTSVIPSINLVLPSPGLNLEVRSFFSDDSSQVPPRGSLRKRLSQLKAIAARTNSTEDVGGAERGLLTSVRGKSRPSGRVSGQEEAKPHVPNTRHIRSRIIGKIKDWFHRGGKRILWRRTK